MITKRGIRIKVTQEHIDRAREALVDEGAYNMCECPVAQAFRERFDVNEVYALTFEVELVFPDKKVSYTPRHGNSVEEFMLDFDNHATVEPKSFIFDLVEE